MVVVGKLVVDIVLSNPLGIYNRGRDWMLDGKGAEGYELVIKVEGRVVILFEITLFWFDYKVEELTGDWLFGKNEVWGN